MSKKHTFKFVKQYFEDRDCELKETEYINNYTKMRYRCDCGNPIICKITFKKFKKGHRCKKCRGGIKFTFEEVYNYFKDRDCELYETEYINSHTLMRYGCNCGNTDCKIRFYSFKQGHRCKECALKRKSGKNNYNYNPNLTDKDRENSRPGCGKWKKDVRERDNNTSQCCFETEGKLIAHHIENYANNKELRTVLSNGFLFCNKHHIEFHKEYGYDCNKEQLEEFLSRIL